MYRLNKLTEKVGDVIWVKIKDYYYNLIAMNPPVIRNINYNSGAIQKKVLLSYLTSGYTVNIEKSSGRTIIPEIFKIVRVFSELEFSIDLTNCNDIKSIEIIKDTKYDMIFGFGEVFYRMSELQPEAITVLYMTEQHPEISYIEEKKRIEYFYERHKRHVPIMRSGMFYRIEHLRKKYNSIITLSETEPLKSMYDNPYTIFPTGIINSQFVFEDKDHSISRKNFLWLGSSAVIHKGLDLLIDIFSRRDDISLHICGLNRKTRELLGIPLGINIIDHGYIDIQSDTFLTLAKECSYSILPSCAEGFATSITTSMLHGLIPIVMRDTGFNRLGDYALFLDDYEITNLTTKITEFSNRDPDTLKRLSMKVYDFARENFVLEKFENNFRSIMKEIIEYD